ncbi:MAG: DMT family transporter, partial [candidate division NC10 bacterium]|nr:DMT family transporter [candidate division NC10 bacterium]
MGLATAGDEGGRWDPQGAGGGRRSAGPGTPRDLGGAPPSWRTVAFILFLCTLWGGNMVAMKVGLQGVPPLATGGFRFLLASLSIVLFARVRRVSLTVEPGLWPHLLALGALFVVQHGVFFLGLNLTSASRSAVFMFTQPVYTVLLAHFLVPGERLTPTRAGGILLSFMGLLVVFGERLGGGNWGTLLGDGLVSVAAVGWALQSIYMKHLVSRTEPFVLTLYQMLIALPWFFLANWLFEPRLVFYVDVRIALAFLYHGSLIAGLTFVAWTTLLRRLQVGQLSAFIFLTPISGVLLSRILLGDPITPGLVAGLVLV